MRKNLLALLICLLVFPMVSVSAEDNEAPRITNVEIVSESDDGNNVDFEKPIINQYKYYFESTNDYIGSVGESVTIRVEAYDNGSGIKSVHYYPSHYLSENDNPEFVKESENIYTNTVAPSKVDFKFGYVEIVDNADNKSYVELKELIVLSSNLKLFNEKEINLLNNEQRIKITFSKEMDINSLNHFGMVKINSDRSENYIKDFDVTLSDDKKSVYIKINEPLDSKYNYYLMIHPYIKDIYGNGLGNPMYFKFRSIGQ